MSETARDFAPKPVTPTFSMVEGLIGVMALRDYTRLRREHGQGEDAVVAYFYQELLLSVRRAAQEDPDGFARAERIARIPETLANDLRRTDG